MISVSSEYKEIMSRPIRNRAYISIGIGIINQNAQGSGKASGNFAYWSYGDIFNANQSKIEYATLEDDFMKADGSMYFLPENNELIQLQKNGVSTEEMYGIVKIEFPEPYAIKGLTIDFSSAFPTKFRIETEEKKITYTNNSEKFATNDVLGDTSFIIIRPIEMVGGNQRLRIKSILMGAGLQYSNQETKSFSLEKYVSSISSDISSESMSYSFFDEENNFDVDDDNSFIDFLETMQEINISFGLELDNGDIEWRQIATQYLQDWKSQNGEVSINATDRLSQMEDEYTLSNRIYQRSAYEEAISIFEDAGLKPDEYLVDDYLQDIILENPMPEGTHKECLQILANACRCIVRQDEYGKIVVRANFANVLDPESLTIYTNGATDWSKPDNLLIGGSVVYAELTQDFLKADGGMYFLPEGDTYLETSYVSKQMGDIYGLFEENPTITIEMPAAYTYYGVNIDFEGNQPKEMVIYTYKYGELQEKVKFNKLSKNSTIFYEFNSFDKMVFEFTKAYPSNRVLVNKISFGSLSDYVLTKTNMLENPIGFKEKRVKSVKVKIFSYVYSDEGEPEEIEDSVFVEKHINSVGETKILQNPLIHTEEHANLLAEWIGNYYANNISYSVKYRGEPRISASDIIHMESEKKNNLQVDVESSKLEFNGTFSGELELRRALKMMEGNDAENN